MPSLSSFFPTEKPGASRGTTKAEMPGVGRAGRVTSQEKGSARGALRGAMTTTTAPALSHSAQRKGKGKQGRQRWVTAGFCSLSHHPPTLVLERLVRRGEDDGGAGLVRVGDPGLGPVQHVLVALVMKKSDARRDMV